MAGPIRNKLPKTPPEVADVTGMVRIDGDGHIFIENEELAARLEETYWANNKPDKGERRGVPVSWERPSSNKKREEREALRVLNHEGASTTPDTAAVSATPDAAAVSATPDTAAVSATPDAAAVSAASYAAGVSATVSSLKPPVVNSLCNC